MKKNKTTRPRRPTASRQQRLGGNGTIYRSSIERRVGDPLMTRYEAAYEPQRFVLQTETVYVPDFLIPKLNLWVEVKGRLDREDRAKVLAFVEQVSDLFVVLLQRPNTKMKDRRATNETWLEAADIPYLHLRDKNDSTVTSRVSTLVDRCYEESITTTTGKLTKEKLKEICHELNQISSGNN